MSNIKIGQIGAGSWGIALANVLTGNGHSVKIWDLDTEMLKAMDADRENKKYLPGVKLNDNVQIVYERDEAVIDMDMVLFAVPAQHFRSAVVPAAKIMKPDAIILNVAKGIEQKTLSIISQIAEEVVPNHTYVDLSGASHAEEVSRNLPTTVVVASKDMAAANKVQDLFMSENFRVYTNNDVTGLELGGALKNIIALGAGISDGMGFGDNTKAALMTRGLLEMFKLGSKMGANEETFYGLSGLGDLIVTCTSMHSRNRRCGILIGEGVSPEEATKKVGMVVEGIYTVEAAYDLSKKYNIEMPITEAIYNVVKCNLDPREAIKDLMTREKRHERDLLVY